MTGSAVRDENSQVGLFVQDILRINPVYLTGVNLTNAHPLHVALVDANGDQVSSFGGGTQYTDAAAAAANPVGTGIIFKNGATYNFVSAAQPLPVLASIDTTGLATSARQDTGNTSLASIVGYVDGIEGLLSTIDSHVDGLEGKDYSTETTLSAINAKIPASPATSGKQDAGNTSLASIDAKIPALGQASSSASVPVVLPAAQITSLTPPTTVIAKIQDGSGIATNAAGNGFLKTTDEPRQIFYDSFDTTIDTTNMWTTATGSSGVAPVVALGVLSMGTGTAANGFSKLNSIPTFKPTIPGWVVYSDAIALPDGVAPTANSYRYWGAGTTPAIPTTTTPITDGYGFELHTDGKLRAVVYAGGTRAVIADLSTSGTSKQPLDASYHRYIIQVRTDKTFFYIDTIDNAGLVATTSFNSPQAQILPKLFICIGGATPPVSNTQIQCTGAVVSDTGKNATQIADGTYPWRKASVSAAGALSVAGVVRDAPAQLADSTTQTLILSPEGRLKAETQNLGDTRLHELAAITNSMSLLSELQAAELSCSQHYSRDFELR
jgi:hypothetical protein